jgi:hypothetical protein
VDELSTKKADSNNAVLTGTTTINGPAFLNGPVALGSSITGIDISNVAGLQNALDLKGSVREPYLYRHHVRYYKTYGWAWQR